MRTLEIPKKIHYCWFGGKPLPRSAKKCIESWKKFFPDYEIVRWDETNFDIDSIPYTREAYDAGKYAFVSDYARFWILYNEGGLYFDTDVEVIKSFDDILGRGPFMGLELPFKAGSDVYESGIAPGLGISVYPEHPIYKEILDHYSGLKFKIVDNKYDLTTVGNHITPIMKKHGLKNVPGIQNVEGILVYPHDYFSPKSPVDRKIRLTENSHSIHHFDATWMSKSRKLKVIMSVKYPKFTRFLLKIRGEKKDRPHTSK